MNIATATPAEIDAKLYEIEAQIQDLGAKRAQREQLIAKPGRYTSEATIEWAREEAAQLSEEIAALNELAKPYNEEFTLRGGWTRAFLVVTNGQGHVHRSMGCSTCNNGIYATKFCWMTEYSGQNEQEIVDAAGERACTVCYASAPVALRLNRPTKMFSEDEKTKAQARDERAAKRAAKNAAIVFDPETGKELYKTERGALNAALSELDSACWYGPTHPSYNEWVALAKTVVRAVAAKRDVQESVVAEELTTKASKKAKREGNKFPVPAL